MLLEVSCQSFISDLSSSSSFQSWDVFFRNANAGAPPGAAYQSPLGLAAASGLAAPQLSSLVGAQPNVEKLVEDHLAVQSLIRAYQVEDHTPQGPGPTEQVPVGFTRVQTPEHNFSNRQ